LGFPSSAEVSLRLQPLRVQHRLGGIACPPDAILFAVERSDPKRVSYYRDRRYALATVLCDAFWARRLNRRSCLQVGVGRTVSGVLFPWRSTASGALYLILSCGAASNAATSWILQGWGAVASFAGALVTSRRGPLSASPSSRDDSQFSDYSPASPGTLPRTVSLGGRHRSDARLVCKAVSAFRRGVLRTPSTSTRGGSRRPRLLSRHTPLLRTSILV